MYVIRWIVSLDASSGVDNEETGDKPSGKIAEMIDVGEASEDVTIQPGLVAAAPAPMPALRWTPAAAARHHRQTQKVPHHSVIILGSGDCWVKIYRMELFHRYVPGHSARWDVSVVFETK